MEHIAELTVVNGVQVRLYHYFVSYNYKHVDGSWGFGNTHVSLSDKLDRITHIRAVERYVIDGNPLFANVVIMNIVPIQGE